MAPILSQKNTLTIIIAITLIAILVLLGYVYKDKLVGRADEPYTSYEPTGLEAITGATDSEGNISHAVVSVDIALTRTPITCPKGWSNTFLKNTTYGGISDGDVVAAVSNPKLFDDSSGEKVIGYDEELVEPFETTKKEVQFRGNPPLPVVFKRAVRAFKATKRTQVKLVWDGHYSFASQDEGGAPAAAGALPLFSSISVQKDTQNARTFPGPKEGIEACVGPRGSPS